MKKKYKPNNYVPLNSKVMGAAMPPLLTNYVALFGFKNSLTNSDIVRMAVRDWHRDKSHKISKERLIKEIITKLQQEWNEMKLRSVKIEEAFNSFKSRTQQKLVKRGADRKDAEDLVNSIDI